MEKWFNEPLDEGPVTTSTPPSSPPSSSTSLLTSSSYTNHPSFTSVSPSYSSVFTPTVAAPSSENMQMFPMRWNNSYEDFAQGGVAVEPQYSGVTRGAMQAVRTFENSFDYSSMQGPYAAYASPGLHRSQENRTSPVYVDRRQNSTFPLSLYIHQPRSQASSSQSSLNQPILVPSFNYSSGTVNGQQFPGNYFACQSQDHCADDAQAQYMDAEQVPLANSATSGRRVTKKRTHSNDDDEGQPGKRSKHSTPDEPEICHIRHKNKTQCGYMFKVDGSDRNEHLREHVEAQIDAKVEKFGPGDRLIKATIKLQCQWSKDGPSRCKNSFTGDRSLNRHYKTHLRPQPCPIRDCEIKYVTTREDSLKKHLREVHGLDDISEVHQ
ncbi:hypothetical protein J3R30DRAFT_2383644 [Lentinula aciculospora]|uniref:C2H2-type domain-containing protein n=1 Tax=Lentinula aciculospora TaxID=153920 RepID=A0A9W9AEJ9_9AGAR|nr:hypothetical protein J3R30DRAFT_2383644 [Lentinula aciculospora]